MKKLLKWFILLGGLGCVIVMGVLAVVLLSSAAQRSIALAVLDDQLDEVSLESVSLNPSLRTLKVNGFKGTKDGIAFELKSAEVEGAFLDAWLQDEIRLDVVDVDGLKVDLTQQSQSKQTKASAAKTQSEPRSATPPKPFDGLLQGAVLPIRLILGEVDIDFEVLMSEAQMIKADVKGGGIAPGARSELQIAGRFVDSNVKAELSSLEINGALSVDQSEASRVSEVNLGLALTAAGKRLETPAKASIRTNIRTDAGKEIYDIRVDNVTNAQSPITLLSMQSRFDSASYELKGSYELGARLEDVKPFFMALPFPQFLFSSKGEYSINTKTRKGVLDTQLTLQASEFEKMDARFGSIANLETRIDLNMGFSENVYALNRLQAEAKRGNGKTLLDVKLLTPFELDVESPGKLGNVPEGELLSVRMVELPIAWIDTWLPQYALSGDSVSMGLKLAHERGSWRVDAIEKVNLKEITVAEGDQVLVEKMDIAFTPASELVGSQLNIELLDMQLKQDDARLLEGKLRTVWNDFPAVSLSTAQFELDTRLPTLFQQPLLSDFEACKSGDFEIKGTYHFNAGGTLVASGMFENVAVHGEERKRIRSAKFDVEASVDWPKNVELKMPMEVMGSGGLTECELTATLKETADGKAVDIQLSGDSLVVDDFSLLAAAFKKGSPEAKAPSAPKEEQPIEKEKAPAPADGAPMWAGYVGQVEVALKKLKTGKARFENLNAAMVIQPEQLNLKPLSFEYLGSKVSGDSVLLYQKGAGKLYDFKSNFDAVNIDIAKLITQGKPGRRSELEGTYQLTSKSYGQADDLTTLLATLKGDFKLEGKAGSLVMLANKSEIRGVTQLAGFAAGIGGFIGSKVGLKSERLNAGLELVDILQRVDYDRVVIEATREANLDFNVETVLFDGPKLRLQGAGRINYEEGRPISEHPVNINAVLSAKGGAAKLFEKFDWLEKESKPDTDGFHQGPHFTIKGSPGKLDYSELTKKVEEALKELTDIIGLRRSEKTGDNDVIPQVEDTVRGVLDSLF